MQELQLRHANFQLQHEGGIEPGPLALGAQSFNYWAIREVPSPLVFWLD